MLMTCLAAAFPDVQVAHQDVRTVRGSLHEVERLLRLTVEGRLAVGTRARPVSGVHVYRRAAPGIPTHGAVNNPHRVLRILVAGRVELKPVGFMGEPVASAEANPVALL